MSRFIYDADVPEIILPDLKRHLEPLGILIPSWCVRVFVGWRSEKSNDEDSAVVQIDTTYHYRWARMTFYGCWLDHDDEQKRNIAIHELVHLAIDPLYKLAHDKIALLAQDEAYRLIKPDLHLKREATVEDLAQIITAIMGPAPSKETRAAD